MALHSMLSEIVAEMEASDQEGVRRLIDHSKVKAWMSSDDVETLGAAYAFIVDKRFSERIEPPLSFADYLPFVLRYHELCVLLNPQGDWSDSRYTAGHQLVAWFNHLSDDSTVPRGALHEIKGWLARLYRQGDADVRNCLVTACLEHLFERPATRKFFADWRKDKVLRIAYKDALEWAAKK